MKNKAYIVKVEQDVFWEIYQYNKFVFLDKSKAEIWVEKFNRIVEENRVRLSDAYYNNKQNLWTKFVTDQNPTAYMEEIEIR